MKPKKVSGLKKFFAAATLGAAGIGVAVPATAEERGSFERYGDKMQYALPIAAYAVAKGKGDDEGAKQVLKGCAITIGSSELLKKIFNLTPLGKRPNGGRNSFVSGHTASAMCGAAFLDQRYGSAYGLPAYALAGSVGFSRMYAEKHHPRDVIGATLLAREVARSVAGEKRDEPFCVPDCTRDFRLTPVGEPAVSDDGLEVNVSVYPVTTQKGHDFGVYIGFSKKF